MKTYDGLGKAEWSNAVQVANRLEIDHSGRSDITGNSITILKDEDVERFESETGLGR